MAANIPDIPPRKRRKFRRRFFLLLVPVLLLAGGWQAAERYIDVERYRGVIDKELELLIELPLTFGAMDLKLFPTPRLVVREVALGEDGFMAFSPEVAVTADLGKLLKKQLDLRVVTIKDLRVQLPEATPDLQRRWGDYMLALATPDAPSGAPMLLVTLESITAPDAQVFRGETLYATGSLRVEGVTDGTPEFQFSVEAVSTPGTPSAEGAFVLDVNEEPLIDGHADVHGLLLSNLTDDTSLPPFVLDGAMTFVQAQNDNFRFSATGQVLLDDYPDALGPFSVDARSEQGDLFLDHVVVKTTPVALDGSLQIMMDNRWSLTLEEATLRDEGIGWLSARLPELPLADCPDRRSTGVLRGVRMGDESGAGYAFHAGEIELEGVGLALGDSYLLPGLRGRVSIAEDTIRIDEFASDALRASGAINLDYRTETIALDLAAQILLSPALPLPASFAGRIRAESGVVDIETLQAVIRAGSLHLPSLHGQATVHGATTSVWDDTTHLFDMAPAIDGAIMLDQGAIHLNALSAAGSVLSGTVTPDDALERWHFETQLKSNLASPFWKPFYPSGTLLIDAGTLDCTTLSGTLVTGAAVPEDLAVEGRIDGLTARVQAGSFDDQFAFGPITLAATSEQLRYTITGTSALAGPFEATGLYSIATGDVDTTINVRPVDGSVLPDALRTDVSNTLLTRLSALPLHVRYAPATDQVTFSAESPAVSGTVNLATVEDRKAPLDLDMTAELPIAWLEPHLSPVISPAGTARLSTTIAARSGEVEVLVDFSNAAFGWGLLRKPEGFPTTIALVGDWTSDGPVLKRGRVEAGSEGIDLTLDGGSVASERISVALTPLSALLPEGATLAGALTGQFQTAPVRATLDLDAVQVQLSDDLPALSISGSLAHADGAWEEANALVGLGDSHGHLNASRTASQWQGELRAETLDVNQLTAAYRDFSAWRANHAPTDDSPDQPPGSTGSLACTVDSVHWADATVTDVRGVVAWAQADIQFNGVTFAHGGGTGSGRAACVWGVDGAPDQVDLSVAVEGVGATLVEGLLMESARGLEGHLDGAVQLSFPIRKDSPSLLNEMNGQITFNGTDGTLGKAGLASKLLTTLRTTDILRLKLPLLKDRGLTFNTLSGEIAIESGVFRLSPYTMADTTYILNGDAVFDFPNDTADGTVEVQVLEGVTGVARRIPLLGEAAGLVNKVFGVPIKIVGPARDPSFRVGMPGATRIPASEGDGLVNRAQRLVGR